MTEDMAIQRNKKDMFPEDAGGKGAASEKSKGKPITVLSYSGYKKDEHPRAFEVDGRRLTVLSVKKTWQEESEKSRRRKNFFQVHCHDGRSYNIALDEGTGQWTLEPWSKAGE